VSVEPREAVRSSRRDVTRERVLDAAREVFAERGVFGATVEEICDRAGFTRGAFYSNFTDKDDVLQALVEREHARLLGYLDPHLDLVEEGQGALVSDAGDGLGPEAILALMVERILASVPGDRLLSLVQTELEIHAIRQPATSGAFIDADARFRDRIADFIERGMARLGRRLTIAPRDAADGAIGVVERSIRLSLLSGSGDPDAMARAVIPGLLLAISRPADGD
jgi:AcrR family transcriptional regulator